MSDEHLGENAEIHLILMSRAPIAGETKTRLTPPLDQNQARDFHAACLMDLIGAACFWRSRGEVRQERISLHLFITPPGSEAAFAGAGVDFPGSLTLHDQQGKNLGDRMALAIGHVRERAGVGGGESLRVILTGTDLPLLGPNHWSEAGEKLLENDVVFGPTHDGGYFLVGLRTGPEGLFDVEDWGGPTVLEQSIRAAESRSLSVATMAPMPDVDTAADLEEVMAHPLALSLSARRSLRLVTGWYADAPAQRS